MSIHKLANSRNTVYTFNVRQNDARVTCSDIDRPRTYTIDRARQFWLELTRSGYRPV